MNAFLFFGSRPRIKIYLVTYYDYIECEPRRITEPTHTAFDNKQAAIDFYNYVAQKHDEVIIDEIPICKKFVFTNQECAKENKL